MSKLITIVDAGIGNLGSVRNMLKKLGVASRLATTPEEIAAANKLVLPGVGAFKRAIENLDRLNLIDALNQRVVKDGVPILGICLGMQLMTNRSEEGEAIGLGWIDADTRKFDFSDEHLELKIPHMGWNSVSVKNSKSPIVSGVFEDPRYYFVHSYYVTCQNSNDVLMTTCHGHEFVSGIWRDNIFGLQFHPEKSHKFGMQVIGNFASCC